MMKLARGTANAAEPSTETLKGYESENEPTGRQKSVQKSLKQRSPTRGKSSGAPIFGRKRSKQSEEQSGLLSMISLSQSNIKKMDD